MFLQYHRILFWRWIFYLPASNPCERLWQWHTQTGSRPKPQDNFLCVWADQEYRTKDQFSDPALFEWLLQGDSVSRSILFFLDDWPENDPAHLPMHRCTNPSPSPKNAVRFR